MGSLEIDLPKRILVEIDDVSKLNSLEFSKKINVEHQKVVGAIKSIESTPGIIEVKSTSIKDYTCSEEGLDIASSGSHEGRLLAWLPKEGATVDAVKTHFPDTANVALGAALKAKWVRKAGALVVPVACGPEDAVQRHMQAVRDGRAADLPPAALKDYKRRKLIRDSDVTVFTASKGPCFSVEVVKQEAELTREMIENGSWEKVAFKPYNFNAKGKREQRPGYLHPLMQLREEFRKIFLEMGFCEMPTNAYVESAFWNFDALFQPQQHPARDAHDTFYVSEPQSTLRLPREYMERVSAVHSSGGYGSSGYRYEWSADEARKNLLRTHTTAVSARMLHRMAQEGFQPAKLFSIDRVFRNETLDATHLAEFQQIEGVVADYGLGIRHLIGLISAFFRKIGIEKLRFKATYNPYTEPSMEVYSYHSGLGKWVELGNSGIFRPEMLRPMGLPEGVTVLGFGLSLERPAMIKFGSNNIRELVGPKVRLEHVFANPVCTVDK